MELEAERVGIIDNCFIPCVPSIPWLVLPCVASQSCQVADNRIAPKAKKPIIGSISMISREIRQGASRASRLAGLFSLVLGLAGIAFAAGKAVGVQGAGDFE